METKDKKIKTKRTKKKVLNYVIDPETGKKISKTWWAIKQLKEPKIEILDMDAVIYGLYRNAKL